MMLDVEQARLVLLCGPIARESQPAKGGYQSANLRISRLLEGLGFQVRHLHYPDLEGSAAGKALAYATSFLKIYGALIAAPRAILHATPLFRHFIGLELVAFALARMCGHQIVCDIRAGDQQHEYETRSSLYRWMFRQLVSLADIVSVENEHYLPFVEAIAKQRQAYVLPNFIPADILKLKRAEKIVDGPRLAFVGRVNDAKGVPQALDVHACLRDLLPEAELTIVGAGEEAYVTRLIEKSRADSSIRILGPLKPGEVLEQLDRAHYFVLLSAHSGEGHSNALTEAMARGCVPVATRHGFLESVVGNAGLTFPDREDSSGIASAVAESWTSGAWKELSRCATSRVEARYTDTAVRHVMIEMYSRFAVQHQAARHVG